MTPEEKNNIDNRLESLRQQSHAVQEKYTYYIMAITVGCVAFSVNLTKDNSLSPELIPLAIAVLFWGISFYYGITSIQNKEVHIALSLEDWKLYSKGLFTPQSIIDDLDMRTLKGRKYRKYQNLSLFVGIIFFLIWHVLHMYSSQN